MRLIIVSGRSGSGKSTALNVLEDNGFYCIDNLPASLLPDQVQHGADGALAARQAAVRNGDAIAEAGGTEFFPGHQVFEDGLGVELRQLPGYQVGDLFEYAFLAAARHVHEGTAGGQDLLKSDHRGGEISGRLRLAAVRDTSLCV